MRQMTDKERKLQAHIVELLGCEAPHGNRDPLSYADFIWERLFEFLHHKQGCRGNEYCECGLIHAVDNVGWEMDQLHG